MKTNRQIRAARKVINESAIKAGLSDQQKMLLMGFSVALCWVQEEGGSTLQQLLDGRPLAVPADGSAPESAVSAKGRSMELSDDWHQDAYGPEGPMGFAVPDGEGGHEVFASYLDAERYAESLFEKHGPQRVYPLLAAAAPDFTPKSWK